MTYKNWPEICKLATVNHVLMMALATLDLRKKECQEIARCLPRYFIDHEVSGPVPMSALESMNASSRFHEGLWTAASNLDLPIVVLIRASEQEENPAAIVLTDDEYYRLQQTLSTYHGGSYAEKYGDKERHDVIEWKGQKLLVLQIVDYMMACTPLECVNPDL